MKIAKFDVSSAFLNATLDKPVYIWQPEGFNDGSKRVCRVKKSLCGLKEAPKCWTKEIVGFFQSLGFQQSEADSCMLVKRGRELTVILLYVDDGLIISSDEKQCEQVLRGLGNKFKITVQRKVDSFLGYDLSIQEGKIKISQEQFSDTEIQI